MFDVAIVQKKLTGKDMPINNHAASKHTGQFIQYVLEQALHPISSGKLQILSSSSSIHQRFRL